MEDKEVKKSTNNKDMTSLLVTALRRHRLGFLIILVMLSVTGVFAWFFYNTVVDFSMQAHVKAWNIKIGDTEGGGTAEFLLGNIYPGVPATSFESLGTCDGSMNNCVLVSNDGEVDAVATLQVNKFYLYSVQQTLGTDYTLSGPDADGIYTISGNYPFVIKFKTSSVDCSSGTCQTLLSPGGSVSLYFGFEWVYDRDVDTYNAECAASSETWCASYDEYIDHYDALDTYYGEQAHEFKVNPQPDREVDQDLVVVLKINFVQATS